MEIRFEPWKEVVLHEVLERKWDDWINVIINNLKAGGGGIPIINWANGMVFQTTPFPSTEKVVEEQLKGIIHYSNVIFALKPNYEESVRKEQWTINLQDVSHNTIFVKLAEELKKQSKFSEK